MECSCFDGKQPLCLETMWYFFFLSYSRSQTSLVVHVSLFIKNFSPISMLSPFLNKNIFSSFIYFSISVILFSKTRSRCLSTPVLFSHLTVSTQLTLVRFGVHRFLEFYLVNITNDFHGVSIQRSLFSYQLSRPLVWWLNHSLLPEIFFIAIWHISAYTDTLSV